MQPTGQTFRKLGLHVCPNLGLLGTTEHGLVAPARSRRLPWPKHGGGSPGDDGTDRGVNERPSVPGSSGRFLPAKAARPSYCRPVIATGPAEVAPGTITPSERRPSGLGNSHAGETGCAWPRGRPWSGRRLWELVVTPPHTDGGICPVGAFHGEPAAQPDASVVGRFECSDQALLAMIDGAKDCPYGGCSGST